VITFSGCNRGTLSKYRPPSLTAYQPKGGELRDPKPLGRLRLSPRLVMEELSFWRDGRGELYLADGVSGTVYLLEGAGGS
jgi:hypothetical protein